MSALTWQHFVARLRWLDGTPLAEKIEPYRAAIFARVFDPPVHERPNLVLAGRAKKNWKTADLALAALFCLVSEAPEGFDSECYILANDQDQARDDLTLVKKLLKVNPGLQHWLRVKRDVIERKDGRGFLEILAGLDVLGSHGKGFEFVGHDEIHGRRTWDIFEALQPDPNRPGALQWITSYASLLHRPGVPLFDLVAAGKSGADPRMLFSWYAADFSTDPNVEKLSPEERANPSMASWGNPEYLAQQQRRLPAHKYRRLHLNLPGLPEGSAFQPEPVMDAFARGLTVRGPEPGIEYRGFVDMSGGSSDDAVLAIAHRDPDGRAILDALQDQGARAPFDPRAAVERFIRTLKAYRLASVTGDTYAGETFKRDFERDGIAYRPARASKSVLYEALEPRLNGGQVELLDVPMLEQQLLGLVWRGGKIDHQHGEHDDYANGVAGVVDVVLEQSAPLQIWGCGQHLAAPDVAAVLAEHQEAARRESAIAVERAAMHGGWFPGGD